MTARVSVLQFFLRDVRFGVPGVTIRKAGNFIRSRRSGQAAAGNAAGVLRSVRQGPFGSTGDILKLTRHSAAGAVRAYRTVPVRQEKLSVIRSPLMR